MLTENIKYTDFSGNEREGILLFNLTRAELVRWLIIDEGLVDRLQNIQTRSGAQIIEEFDGLIKKSYGIRSEDGKRFVKNDEIYGDLIQTAAYDEFFMGLMTDPEKAKAFVNGIMPAELIQEAQKDLQMQKDAGLVKPADPKQDAGGASGI